MWYIGDKFGENLAYAWNRGTAQCPEELNNVWEWYNWEEGNGVMVLDPEAEVVCA